MTSPVAASPIQHPKYPEFVRAAGEKDTITTNLLLKNVFGTQDVIQYGSLDKLKEDYTALQETIASYHPTYHLDKMPALHRAAFKGELSPFQKLTSPVLFNAKDLKGLTPLHYALLSKQKPLIQELLTKTDLSYQTPSGNTYLHYAALTGDREILDLICSAPAGSFSVRNQQGLSAAQLWAASSDDFETLARLATAEAPLLAQDQTELSPIGILLLKAASQYRKPLTTEDLQLCGLNLASLAIAALTRSFASSPDQQVIIRTAHLAHTISAVAKRSLFIEQMAPKDSLIAKGFSKADHSEILSEIFFASLGSSAIPFNLVARSTAAALTTQHAITALQDNKYASWKTWLLALPVHSINVVGTALDALLAYNAAPVFTPPPSLAPAPCPKMMPNTYENKTHIERFADTQLSQEINKPVIHPTTQMQCLNNYRIMFDPAKAQTDWNATPSADSSLCDDAAFRALKAAMHPDKNRDNPLAQIAFPNLVNAHKHLCESNGNDLTPPMPSWFDVFTFGVFAASPKAP